ncbi:hypothetical protein [Burkholderia gladioli]|uniref:hypothetical protein n=1 Tax=Burkholderia gladioli TaxID=28095 RepID=UPI001641779D|nr:hypothetical protein [Burkholderia gladioli]
MIIFDIDTACVALEGIIGSRRLACPLARSRDQGKSGASPGSPAAFATGSKTTETAVDQDSTGIGESDSKAPSLAVTPRSSQK